MAGQSLSFQRTAGKRNSHQWDDAAGDLVHRLPDLRDAELAASSRRFTQVRDRIQAPFGHRDETPPTPDPRANPFRLPGIPVTVAAREDAPAAPDAASNLTMLQQSAATLRFSGVFEIGGRSHPVINARPYKEGDVVQTQTRSAAQGGLMVGVERVVPNALGRSCSERLRRNALGTTRSTCSLLKASDPALPAARPAMFAS